MKRGHVIAVLAGASIFLSSCTGSVKKVRSVDCPSGGAIVMTRHSEFVGLSIRDVYHLAYEGGSSTDIRRVTGNIHILPTAARYRNMIKVRDFDPGRGKSLFEYHYVFPSEFTPDEFENICLCLEKNFGSFPELVKKTGALVYGDYRDFREVFSTVDKFFITTENDGNLSIRDDPSLYAMTLPAEKHHFNNIGFFDDKNRLYLRKGRIVSGVKTGFFGKPVKEVLFEALPGREAHKGEMEILWCDILYSEEKSGINRDYILSAINEKGEKLGEVFRAAE